MAKDDGQHICGRTESQFGEKDTSASRKRVFLAKFDENLEMVDYTVLIGEGPEFINYKGYDFAKEEKTYYAGNSSYNSPIAVDEDGNIYIVTQEEASRSLTTSIWDISWDFDDCICEFYCDDEECDMGLTEDCPVCNAFREFEATFVEGKSVDFVLYKFDSDLQEIDKFTIASAHEQILPTAGL